MRYESLELRLQQVQAQLAGAAERAAAAESLQAQLAALSAEHAVLRTASSAAADSRDAELARLSEGNANLRDEVASLRSLVETLRAGSSTSMNGGLGGVGGAAATPRASVSLDRSASNLTSLSGAGGRELGHLRTQSEAGDSTMDTVRAGGLGGGEASLSNVHLAALAEHEREVAIAHRRATELEAEVADLERECQLRQAQEAVLKEAVRDLQREIERLQLPGRQLDMEYFKVGGG